MDRLWLLTVLLIATIIPFAASSSLSPHDSTGSLRIDCDYLVNQSHTGGTMDVLVNLRNTLAQHSVQLSRGFHERQVHWARPVASQHEDNMVSHSNPFVTVVTQSHGMAHLCDVDQRQFRTEPAGKVQLSLVHHDEGPAISSRLSRAMDSTLSERHTPTVLAISEVSQMALFVNRVSSPVWFSTPREKPNSIRNSAILPTPSRDLLGLDEPGRSLSSTIRSSLSRSAIGTGSGFSVEYEIPYSPSNSVGHVERGPRLVAQTSPLWFKSHHLELYDPPVQQDKSCQLPAATRTRTRRLSTQSHGCNTTRIEPSDTPCSSQDSFLIVIRNETVMLHASLSQNLPAPASIANQEIEFYDETHNLFLGSSKTNSDGVAVLAWTPPPDISLGPALLNATFRGNESVFLAPSVQWISVTIYARTQILLELERNKLAPGDWLMARIHLLDDWDKPIGNACVSVEGTDAPLLGGVTDSQGLALLKMVCNTSWAQYGENTIVVHYNRDDLLYFSDAHAVATFVMSRIATSIVLSSDVPLSNLGCNNINFSLAIRAEGKALAGAPVDVLIDGVHSLTETSNSSGHIFILISLNRSLALGSHSLRAVYVGSERYEPCSLEVEFNMTSLVRLNIESDTPLVIGEWGSLRITLHDTLGRPVANASVAVREGPNQLFVVPMNGRTTVDTWFLVDSTPGRHKLSLQIIGNPFIINSSTTVDVIFWSRLLLDVETGINGYAFPLQKVLIAVRVSDWWGNRQGVLLQIYINDSLEYETTSGLDGAVALQVRAPREEGRYSFVVVATGNEYELEGHVALTVHVRRKIPASVEIESYEVVPPLQHIELRLRIWLLNGTPFNGPLFNYTWLDVQHTVVGAKNGCLALYLKVPSLPGVYTLHYVVFGPCVLVSTGMLELSLSVSDIAVSQGVGFGPLLGTIVMSVSLVAFAVARRHTVVR